MVARFQTLFSIVNFTGTDYADTQSTEPERGFDRLDKRRQFGF